ncbi:MAG: hypothetical protein AAF500_18065 [Myxococcota bacterium]
MVIRYAGRDWIEITKRAALGAILAVGAGCGESAADPTPSPPTELSYPLLDCDPLVPEFCGFPFPSNVYSVEDTGTVTGRRVSFGPGLLQDNDDAPWARSDGFSAGTPIVTFLPDATQDGLASAARIGDSLGNDSRTLILDTETGEIVLHLAELDVQASNASERAFVIRPGTRLRDNARYIVAIRNVHNTAGEVIEASPAFAALRDGTESDEPSVEARRALYEDIFARLEEVGWSRDELQSAWDFNTASDENNTRDLLHMRDEGLALVGDAPEYTITRVDTDYRPEDIAFRIIGTLRVPLYLSRDTPGAVLVRDENGTPKVNEDQPWAEYPFEVLIPQSALTEPAPLLQYGHGAFDDYTQVQLRSLREFINEYNYVIFGVDLLGMTESDLGPIGLPLSVGNVAGLQPMWDGLLQGHLNSQIAMRMMIESFSNDPEYGRYIDPTRRYYHGISQGAISGAVYMSLSNDVERGAFAVGGQPYSTLLFRSNRFDPFLELLEPNYPDARARQLLVALVQMPWDRSEPNGFSHHILKDRFDNTIPKQILSSAATGDHGMPNLVTDIMSRAIGLKHLTTGLRDVVGLETIGETTSESFYIEYDFGLPPVPDCGVPMSLCEDPHGAQPSLPEALFAMDAFFRTGEGNNNCPNGVCSFPDIGACEPEENADATLALCSL